MADDKFHRIKQRLAQGLSALSQQDVEWLVTRVEELTKENDWLRKELSYAEHQGEVFF